MPQLKKIISFLKHLSNFNNHKQISNFGRIQQFILIRKLYKEICLRDVATGGIVVPSALHRFKWFGEYKLQLNCQQKMNVTNLYHSIMILVVGV